MLGKLLKRLMMGAGADPRMCGAPRSPHWSAVRDKFIADHPTCAACGGTTDLQAHHRKPFHLFRRLELDPTNLITLCEAPNRLCHLRVGHAWNFRCWNPFVAEDAALELKRMQERKEGA